MILSNSNNSQEQGKIAEEKVSQYLIKNNFKIIQRNYTYKHLEIDIIALSKNELLIFIEVKYRKKKLANGFNIYDSISHKKKNNIIRCASYFRTKYPQYKNLFCQYDIVFCYYQQKDFMIEHFPNAFTS